MNELYAYCFLSFAGYTNSLDSCLTIVQRKSQCLITGN